MVSKFCRNLILFISVVTPVSLATFSRATWAQDPPRFQPPRPPSDQDFEDPMDDEMELGDQPNRMPPTQVPLGGVPQPPPPPVTDFRPQQSSPSSEQGKLRFKVVEGAFFEKGKPRGRAAPADRR